MNLKVYFLISQLKHIFRLMDWENDFNFTDKICFSSPMKFHVYFLLKALGQMPVP